MQYELWITCGVLCVLGCLLLLVGYAKLSAGVCTCRTDMSDKVVLVTGASSGLGLETAREMALRGARVIMGCRDLNRGREALHDIVTTTGNSFVVLKKLDLGSLGSVRGFAEDLLTSQDRLDVVVSNAAVVTRQARTEDGLERVMTTNYFGPFLLVNLLRPLLSKCAPSRIVVVTESNAVIRRSNVQMDCLNGEKVMGLLEAYSTSKLALTLFASELATRLAGTGVTVNALHPGYSRTGLARDLPRLFRFPLAVVQFLFFKSPARGAQTSVHLAVSERLSDVTGKYFSDCREYQLAKNALDTDLAKQLWSVSEQITGLDPV